MAAAAVVVVRGGAWMGAGRVNERFHHLATHGPRRLTLLRRAIGRSLLTLCRLLSAVCSLPSPVLSTIYPLPIWFGSLLCHDFVGGFARVAPHRKNNMDQVTGPCQPNHLLNKFPDASSHLAGVVSVAPAFYHNDFRCNNLWFKSIAEWKRRLLQLEAEEVLKAGPAASVRSPSDTAAVVFNAPREALSNVLAADGVLRVGWANGLPVSFLSNVCGFLKPRDLFQMAYMCVLDRDVCPFMTSDIWARVVGCCLLGAASRVQQHLAEGAGGGECDNIVSSQVYRLAGPGRPVPTRPTLPVRPAHGAQFSFLFLLLCDKCCVTMLLFSLISCCCCCCC